MRSKYWIGVVCCFGWFIQQVNAQCSFTINIDAADTVCLAGDVSFTSPTMNVVEQTWDLYSGDLHGGIVSTTDLGNPNGLIESPWGFTVVEENGLYYGFAAISTPVSILRSDYGADLSAVTAPNTITLGNPNGALPDLKRGLKFYGNRAYAIAGNNFATSQMIEFQFNNGIGNPPDSTRNFFNTTVANYEYKAPKNLRIIEGDNDSIFFFSCNANYISVLSPGTTTDSIPKLLYKIEVLNGVNNSNFAYDIDIVKICDKWMGYGILNNDDVIVVDFGSSLNNIPTLTNIGNPNSAIVGVSYYCEVVVAEGNVYMMAQLNNGALVRFNFGADGESITPLTTTYPAAFATGSAFGFDLIKSNSAWYAMGINRSTKKVYKSTFANAVDVPEAISTNSTITSIPYVNAGTYNIELIGKDLNGNVSSHLDTLEVQEAIIPGYVVEGGCADQPVTFTDASISGSLVPQSWTYDFGNGDSSSLANTEYLFPGTGVYYVSQYLTADNGCVTVFADSVEVSNLKPEFPDFGIMPDIICENTLIDLFDSTTTVQDSVYGHYWDFGNGDTSLLPNAQYQYTSAGIKTISLTVSGMFGCDTTVSKTIQVQQGPNTSFISENLCFGETTEFTDQSMSNPPSQIISWNWNFGDGDTSVLQNPDKLYAAPGVYSVELSVGTDSGCVATAQQSVLIETLPIAAFGYDVTCAQTNVQFTDLTSGTIDSWYWQTSEGLAFDQNPVFNFPNEGDEEVVLVVTSMAGCVDTLSQMVEVFPAFVADFDFENVCLGDEVSFTDNTNSLSVVDWQWSFGLPNAFSIEQNPTYMYTTSDTFEVELSIENAIGCVSSLVKEVVITETPIVNWLNDTACVGGVTNFVDASILGAGDTVNSYMWSINGDVFNDVSLVEYQFQDTGVYDLSLQIQTLNGCDITENGSLEVYNNPIAAFRFSPDYGTAPIDIEFINESVGGQNFSWDFGDGAGSSLLENPIYTYTANSVYDVLLEVTNEFGCTDQLLQPLAIVPSQLDIELTNLIVQEEVQSDGSVYVSAQVFFKNVGSRPITKADLRLSVNAAPALVETWEGEELAVGATAFYSFQSKYIVPQGVTGKYVCATITNVNDGTEVNYENNEACVLLEGQNQLSPPYPNPASNHVFFKVITANPTKASISVVSNLGQTIANYQDYSLKKGVNEISIPTAAILSGKYFIKVAIQNDDYLLPFIISNE